MAECKYRGAPFLDADIIIEKGMMEIQPKGIRFAKDACEILSREVGLEVTCDHDDMDDIACPIAIKENQLVQIVARQQRNN